MEDAGLPERVAEEVAERVEDRVQDRWTTTQVNEQVDIELKRLDEDIHRAEGNYKEKITGARSEVFIPAAEKERHEDYEVRRYGPVLFVFAHGHFSWGNRNLYA